MRAAGNEADVVFQSNEKIVIFNNPLFARIGQLARNFIQLNSLFTCINSNKITECFSSSIPQIIIKCQNLTQKFGCLKEIR